MKSLRAPRSLLAALLPLCWLAPAGAQSLGAAQAAPWIGQPLDVSVPARFASADASDECVRADVLYGGQRLLASQVRATVSGAADQRRVRILANTPIDEPVVTVVLRAGCRNSVSRTYTLLPEMPSSPALAAAAARSAGAPGAMDGAGQAALTAPTKPRAVPVPQTPRLARASRAVPADTPTPVRTAPAQRAGEAGATARLRLDAGEPDADLPQGTLLRVSARMTPPIQDAAAALLWQGLNAEPAAQLLRTGDTLQRLEGELVNLRSSAGQTQAEMAALQQLLDAPAPGVPFPGRLVLALTLLALAGMGGLLWWRTARRQQAGSWPSRAPDSPLDSVAPRQETPPPPAAPRQEPPSPVAPKATPAVRQSPGRGAEAGLVPQAPVASAEPPPLEFDIAPPAPILRRSAAAASPLRVETLAVNLQEVEFLASIGLRGDAADVLGSYIGDRGQSAPVAYFELMRLYAHANDADALEAVRARYTQAFGVEPPPLAQIDAPGGLQARPDLAAQVARVWGTPQVLETIADLLFAVPDNDQALSPETARDLVCLHKVASQLQREDAAGTGGVRGSAGHGFAPAAPAGEAGPARASSGLDLDLDLDLDALASELQPRADAATASLPLDDPSDVPGEAALHGSRRPLPR